MNDEYQSRLAYLAAQQRLLERDLRTNNKLIPEDIADLEVIVRRGLNENSYTLDELEDLHLKNGRIYGKANVTSVGTDDGNSIRHHTAAIDFHTDHTYSVIFDEHKIGGDEWRTSNNNMVFKLTYNNGTQKLYLNDTAIYSFKAGNTRIVLNELFKKDGVVKEVTRLNDMFGVPYSDKNYEINTKSIANNIKNKSGLKDYGLGFIVSSFDNDWGLRIITQITDDDIARNNLDKAAINAWIKDKPAL